MLEHVRSRRGRSARSLPTHPPAGSLTPCASAPEAVAPLLPAQRRIWLQQRLFPMGGAHAVPIVLRLEGRLDDATVQQALDALVARHPALRTTIADRDGDPVQCVWPATGMRLERPRLRRKLTGRDDDGSEAALRILIDAAAHAPCDLEQGPLIRAQLIKSAPRSHVLVLIVHAIICDEVSRRTLIREFFQIHRAFAAGRPDPLPPLPVAAHHIAAEREADRDGAAQTASLDWWRSTLAGVETIQLPADRAAPPLPSQRSGRAPCVIPAAILGPLRALADAEDATLFMAMLAAFAALLARVAGSDDIAIGTPISTRSEAAAGVVGQLANTVLLRVDLAGDPTFRDLVRRARIVVRDAFAQSAAPFERIVAALQPHRGLHIPLAPVTLAIHDAPPTALTFNRRAAAVVDADTGACLDDLSLDLDAADMALHGWWRYSRDRFEPATIDRLARQFEMLLRAAVAAPDVPLAAISLLTDAERTRIFDKWNPPATPLTTPTSIHAAFERQAAAAPASPALHFDDETISYVALAEQAATLARVLRRRGVVPGATVGICLDRTPALPVAMLAVWQAGGVCVPLDPAYPAARLAFMLDDAKASLIVTDARGEASLPPSATPCLRLDRPLPPDEPGSRGATASDATLAGAAAYVVYTSGSTGEPKGVVGAHLGAVNLCRWLGEAYPFAPDDVCAFIASASFVDAIWDLCGPLLNGGATVVVPEAVRKDPERLIEMLAERRVTRLLAPPSLLRAMLDTDADFGAETPALRLLFSTAETLPPNLVERIAERIPQARLINTYGLSETSAVVTTTEVSPEAAGRPRIPIGRPIANCRVYVLDPRGAPAPVGAPGEIAVGGAAVAAGYFGRTDLTAERFGPDPFAADPAGRLFRTGDRGRWLADGSLELLGRADRLVKIRGFRVEPGEVEAALTGHPAIRDAAVVARADAREARLVAYVVARATPAPTADELRAFLRGRLPEFMLPSQFVPLAAMPRTATGKLDRRALPAAAHLVRPAACVAPRTPTEAALAAIWEQLLEAGPIGVDDNFFDLGGQSLLVVRTMAATRAALGVDLPARVLFEAPTIAALAARIDTRRRDAPSNDGAAAEAITPLNPGGAGGGIYLIPGGAGEAYNLVPFAKLFRNAAPERPAWGFVGRERFDGAGDPQTWVRDIAAQYLRELRARQPDGPYIIVGACAGGNVAFEMAQQLHAAGARVDRLILMDVWHPGGRTVRRPSIRLVTGTRPHAQRLQERLAARGLGAADGSDDAINALRAASRATLERRFWLNQYDAEPYPLPITLLVNEEWHAENATLGWHVAAAGGLDVIVMAGSHDAYLDGHFDDTVVQMRAVLASIAAGAASSPTEEP